VIEPVVRKVLEEHGRLTVDVAAVQPGDDLYRLGLTSHSSVNLMLALEAAFDFEFPEHMLRKSTFESISSICEAIEELTPN
jgi:acyl carrier protein